MTSQDTTLLRALLCERAAIQLKVQEEADSLIQQYSAEIRRCAMTQGVTLDDYGISDEHRELFMAAYDMTSPSALHRKLLVIGLRSVVASLCARTP